MIVLFTVQKVYHNKLRNTRYMISKICLSWNVFPFMGININQSLPIPKSNPGEVIKEDPFHEESYI